MGIIKEIRSGQGGSEINFTTVIPLANGGNLIDRIIQREQKEPTRKITYITPQGLREQLLSNKRYKLNQALPRR